MGTVSKLYVSNNTWIYVYIKKTLQNFNSNSNYNSREFQLQFQLQLREFQLQLQFQLRQVSCLSTPTPTPTPGVSTPTPTPTPASLLNINSNSNSNSGGFNSNSNSNSGVDSNPALGASASAGMVLTPKARIFRLQHQKSSFSRGEFWWPAAELQPSNGTYEDAVNEQSAGRSPWCRRGPDVLLILSTAKTSKWWSWSLSCWIYF